MRIIGGRFRSRRLRFPRTRKTRPMTDRMKAMVFDMLGELVTGVRVLDLFAGSGSLGIEALSRGAGHVTFVEQGSWGLKCIGENLRALDLRERTWMIKRDAFRAVRSLERRAEKYGLIFLDPPYNKGLVKKILMRLERSDIVMPQTHLVLHRSRQENLPKDLEKLKVYRERKVGQACLSFLSGGN